MYVVATAGHVDHGKSTLVRALTGRDPDRLEEERRRGLTIELGYAWTRLSDVASLPGGDDVAFVDVPGHERFVATALAGLGPAPVALLVVAADDPWMPQAAEHLAALDALGVGHGLLVVTRSDLADPGPARDAARTHLAGTSLAGVGDVAVSARTGAGLEDLRSRLTGVLAGLPAPDPVAPVRLWVDRRFTVRGTGTVVTGTLPAGTVRVGDALSGPDGARVRIRGLESLDVPREQVSGTARVALALAGDTEALRRGDPLVSEDAWTVTDEVDLRVPGDAGDLPRGPVVHVGSASVGGRLRRLGGDHVRVRLERALPLHVGDRLLLRDPGRRRVWRADVVDPRPEPLRGRGAAAERATVLARDDGTIAARLRRRGLLRVDDVRRLGLSGAPPADAMVAGDWLVDATRVEPARAGLAELADDAGAAGLPLAEAARRLALPVEVVDALLADHTRRPGEVEARLTSREGRIHAAAALPPELAAKLERLRTHLGANPLAAPDTPWLAEHAITAADVALLVRAGAVLRPADGVVLLAGADDEATARLAELPSPFTVADARRAWSVSRRVALPLLAHLDRTGRTVRLPDDRRRLRGSSASP